MRFTQTKYQFMKISKYISEFLGTGFLFCAVVASYIGAAYWFTSSTSFANPAGTIGRMFSNSFAGINPENVLCFCRAQIFGSILAFLVYRYSFKTN